MYGIGAHNLKKFELLDIARLWYNTLRQIASARVFSGPRSRYLPHPQSTGFLRSLPSVTSLVGSLYNRNFHSAPEVEGSVACALETRNH